MPDMHHPPRSPPTHVDADIPPAGVAATASRFFVSMRKSFRAPSPPQRKTADSPVRRSAFPLDVAPSHALPAQRAAMYSTPEERHAHTTSRASRSRYLDSRPTIEQIAMGLHVSCTPHLRPTHPLQRYPIPPYSPCHGRNTPTLPPCGSSNTSSPQYRTRHSLPPPPPRSSMKKTSPSVSTLTQRPLSAPTSPTPVTPGNSRPLSSLRARMSKFFPGHRPLSFPSSLGRASSFTSSASDSTRPTTPRKAVRFSTSVLAIDEQS